MKSYDAISGITLTILLTLHSFALLASDTEHIVAINRLTPAQQEFVDCVAENFYDTQFDSAFKSHYDTLKPALLQKKTF